MVCVCDVCVGMGVMCVSDGFVVCVVCCGVGMCDDVMCCDDCFVMMDDDDGMCDVVVVFVNFLFVDVCGCVVNFLSGFEVM